MTRQKFCVGEEVMIRGIATSEYDSDGTEVVSAKYKEAGTGRRIYSADPTSAGWKYQTACQPDMFAWWNEESLRKLPPKKRLSYNDMMDSLNRETA